MDDTGITGDCIKWGFRTSINHGSRFLVKPTKVIVLRVKVNASVQSVICHRDRYHKTLARMIYYRVNSNGNYSRRQSYSQKPTRVSVWTPGVAKLRGVVSRCSAARPARKYNVRHEKFSRGSVSITRVCSLGITRKDTWTSSYFYIVRYTRTHTQSCARLSR